MLLAIVSARSASHDPVLATCLIGGAVASVIGMLIRFWSFEVENDELKG